MEKSREYLELAKTSFEADDEEEEGNSTPNLE